ncbi:MAG: STAS-like domain-containing protein [Bacteroidales bacterium]|nr:STAS-like domain-containing protein [Bacteroidales bacterium]
MKTIDLSIYSPIISEQKISATILNNIKDTLKEEDIITIDMSGIKSMATFCAKQIFGGLYKELGSENFFKRIEIKNATDNVKTIIIISIENNN